MILFLNNYSFFNSHACLYYFHCLFSRYTNYQKFMLSAKMGMGML